MEHIQITLASARVNANMTQEEVANALNVTKATINAWENGKSEPKISQARELSNLYQMPIDYLIFLPCQSK